MTQRVVKYPKMMAFRMSESDAQKLQRLSVSLELSPAQVLRRLLRDVHPTGLPALTLATSAGHGELPS